MAVDSSNDQELALKKRARRRLVGAIALVLFMVIVLPKILQDRAALAPQEAIKITMPEELAAGAAVVANNNKVNNEPEPEAVDIIEPVVMGSPNDSEVGDTENVRTTSQERNNATDSKEEDKNTKDKKTGEKKPELKIAQSIKPSDIKTTDSKSNESKPKEAKTPSTNDESFTIQVGVFSDLANVKQLQARLKQVGLDSRTENITTPKGEKIRLRAGRFASRQEAAYALTKLQAADLTGMVISNN